MEPYWSRVTAEPDVYIIDFGLAAQGHDLIALATYKPQALQPTEGMAAIRLHILQLSTGQHHPIASQPVMYVLDTSSLPEASLACVQIVGDLLGILLIFDFAAHPDEFALYNWKS